MVPVSPYVGGAFLIECSTPTAQKMITRTAIGCRHKRPTISDTVTNGAPSDPPVCSPPGRRAALIQHRQASQ